MAETVRIFDTTLRDGEQSPGATMYTEEKLVMARQLERLGVDVIEAGFASSSDGDFEAVSRVAEAVSKPVVLSLARTKEQDIERAAKAVERAKRPGIHVFIATSDIHLEHKLMMSRQEVLEATGWAVQLAKKYLDYVEFSAEDASRSDVEYLKSVLAEAIRAGASVVNVPDTTGYAIPDEFGGFFGRLVAETPGAGEVVWSVHCHNDLGLAVANSLAAVRAGARQVECTVNGIGERAGNTSMEELVMALKTRRDFLGLTANVVTEQIFPSSRLLSQITGMTVPLNKPVVGRNAFAHEAGIHQDGVLKYQMTYEIMRPETVGISSNRLVLGKHSGRHAFVERLKSLGVEIPGIDVNQAFDQFKALADKKKEIYEEDILSIVAEQAAKVPERFELAYLNVTSSSEAIPHATVKLKIDGEIHLENAVGDGMVDACYQAIAKATGSHCKLERYSVKAITGGADAQGEVACVLREDDITVTGIGSHTDIIQASALAYINALNRLECRKKYQQRFKPQGV